MRSRCGQAQLESVAQGIDVTQRRSRGFGFQCVVDRTRHKLEGAQGEGGGDAPTDFRLLVELATRTRTRTRTLEERKFKQYTDMLIEFSPRRKLTLRECAARGDDIGGRRWRDMEPGSMRADRAPWRSPPESGSPRR